MYSKFWKNVQRLIKLINLMTKKVNYIINTLSKYKRVFFGDKNIALIYILNPKRVLEQILYL